MKTAEEITKELIDVARWNGVYNGEYQIFSNEILKEFEKEIRKDQVNKCVEAVRNDSSRTHISTNVHDGVFMPADDVEQAIISTIEDK